jgi:hypothetical protein
MEPSSQSGLLPSCRLASVSAQLSTLGSRQAIAGSTLQLSLPEAQAASLRQPAVCSAGQPPSGKPAGGSSKSQGGGGGGRARFNFSRRAAGIRLGAGAGAGAFLVRL